MFLLLLPASVWSGSFWGFDGEREAFHGHVWETPLDGFSEASYSAAVERIIAAFEARKGSELQPGARGKAGIKLYTHSGFGLKTPHGLTRAVISALERRGFSRDDIILFDTRETGLRAAGYLPPLSARDQGPYFDGVRVLHLDDPALRDPVWYYDSPLPDEFSNPMTRELLGGAQFDMEPGQMRRSYLASPLINQVDFWINLPMAIEQYAVGVSGAMVNASIWNITNHRRFLGSPVNAPIAVAEISAIPELLDTWAFSIVTLESYQFIGGPFFNAHYTRSEPLMWLAVDPVILDVLLLDRFNEARSARGFEELGSLLPYMEFAVNFRLGHASLSQMRRHWVEASEDTESSNP